MPNEILAVNRPKPRQPQIMSTWLSVDAEEAMLIAMCIQTLRDDAPLPQTWDQSAAAADRLAWKLRDLVPAAVRQWETANPEV